MTRRPYRGARSVFWIVGSGSAHQGSTAAQRLRNRHGNPVVVHGLIHASWLNQIEIYFPIVPQKLLAPNDFTPLVDLPQRLMASSHHCNRIRLYEMKRPAKSVSKSGRGGKGLHASAGRKGTAEVWCGESSQFHVLTFFRGTVSCLKSPSGTAKALVLNSE